MALVIKGSSSGQVTVDVPASAGTNTVVIPANSGNIVTSASEVSDLPSAPSFSAKVSVAQTVSASTYTKIQYDSEEWDTDSKYDNSAYRFTPTVAGYYVFNIGARFNSSTTNIVALYKNGVLWRRGVQSGQQQTNLTIMAVADTDDYFEAFGFTTGTQVTVNDDDTYFQAHFVRNAS
tara:strand:+ start:112 stop:642 length:531 start_codon:yes stop_codon:yes gene_type:complete